MKLTADQAEAIGLIYAGFVQLRDTNLHLGGGNVVEARAEGSTVSFLITEIGNATRYTDSIGFGKTYTLDQLRGGEHRS